MALSVVVALMPPWLVAPPLLLALLCLHRMERICARGHQVRNASYLNSLWQAGLLVLLLPPFLRLAHEVFDREPDPTLGLLLIGSLAYMTNRAGKVLFARYTFSQVRTAIWLLGLFDFLLLLDWELSPYVKLRYVSPAFSSIVLLVIGWGLFLAWVRRLERHAARLTKAAEIQARHELE